jgi:predicted glycogen debranching enzyme
MERIRPPQIRHYPTASTLEWVETDGVGGVSASSILNANTRKQHGLLSAIREQGGRIVLVANLQETIVDETHAYDLSTNAYLGAVHPAGYLALESFTTTPWPTWRYRFETAAVEKQIVTVHGEHTVIVTYTLTYGDRPVLLVVRPLLAFRHYNAVRSERDSFPRNWQVSREFVECRPFDEGPTLFIAHPNATVETIGLWYRGFLYERDRESHLDYLEDLFHPGYFEMTLTQDTPCSLVFSSPSPRPLEMVTGYLAAERERREAVTRIAAGRTDALFEALLRSADIFIYEGINGFPAIHPGLPWGECEFYRGLIALPGLLLAPGRFEAARDYLNGMAETWRKTPSPTRFAPETVVGQMHPADVPLWLFVAGWHYWKATGDGSFAGDVLLPLLESIAERYTSGNEVRCTEEGLIEVGHEPGADYAPILPLGTNALWFNAQMILSELSELHSPTQKERWRTRAKRMQSAFMALFSREGRAEFADGVRRTPFRQDETMRPSQVLTVGLPYAVAENPRAVIQVIREHLATPLGLRTLSPGDVRYVGDGRDVKHLPKYWSGSVDPTWFGCYCDALKRAGVSISAPALFTPFEMELHQRGYGHISGACTGDRPYEPCDYVASASAVGEVLRIYAREVVQIGHAI